MNTAGKMRKAGNDRVRFAIFKTKWGYFGLVGGEKGVFRTCLPLADAEKVKRQLVRGLAEVRYDEAFFKKLQGQITAYFEGAYVDFGKDIPIVLDGFGLFARSVLRACREVSYGRTMSYGQLAEKIGRAGAGRAVGGALARNRLALIIPCHRIGYANGQIGGFSAADVTLKEKMLELERQRTK